MKLLIAGSRSIKEFDLSLHVPTETELIISGGAEGVDRLAEEYADAYLPMDEIFHTEAEEEPTYYAADGVHPTPDGACYIGEAYLRTVAPLIEAFVED